MVPPFISGWLMKQTNSYILNHVDPLAQKWWHPNIVFVRSHFSHVFFSKNPQIFGLQKTWWSQLRGWSGGIGVHNHCALWGAESLHWASASGWPQATWRIGSSQDLEDHVGHSPHPGKMKTAWKLRIRGGTPLEKEKNLKQSIMTSGSMSIFRGVITMVSL